MAGRGLKVLKLWMDDLGGTVPKLGGEIAAAIIDEAHKLGMRVSAHVFFCQDAELLVDAGVDALAHSVRDTLIPAALADAMAEQGTCLIPTLAREENSIQFVATENEYFSDPLFIDCAGKRLEPLRAAQSMKTAAELARLQHSFEVAMQNLARCAEAGVRICMGTDCGFRWKLPGFSQIRELELMERAGLPPSEILKSALQSNYMFFADQAAQLEPGDWADFILVRGNPLSDLSALRKAMGIWKRGQRLSAPSSTSDDADRTPLSEACC